MVAEEGIRPGMRRDGRVDKMAERHTAILSPPPRPARITVSDDVIARELTPRGLFVNAFRVDFDVSLGAFRQAKTSQIANGELKGRKRPRFHIGGAAVFAYGRGLDEFTDPRFSSAIVTPASEPALTLRLVREGLAAHLRDAGYTAHDSKYGIRVIDLHTVIRSSENELLRLVPEYVVQPMAVDDLAGNTFVTVVIEPGWTTAAQFPLSQNLKKHAHLLKGCKLEVHCGSCRAGCPLYADRGRIVGRFETFAGEGTLIETMCDTSDYEPVPTIIVDSKANPERRVIAPGQILRPAVGERAALDLFSEKEALRSAARQWLGDWTVSRQLRADALNVRYRRIQHLLANAAGDALKSISFALSSGGRATMTRLPVTVGDVDGEPSHG